MKTEVDIRIYCRTISKELFRDAFLSWTSKQLRYAKKYFV